MTSYSNHSRLGTKSSLASELDSGMSLSDWAPMFAAREQSDCTLRGFDSCS